MKNIRAIIGEHAGDLGDDVVEAIVKEVNANYKTIAEFDKRAARAAELEASVADLTKAVEAAKGGEDELAELRQKVRDMQDAESRRAEAEQTAKERAKFEEAFDAALGERRFANPLIRETVFEGAWAKCKGNVGLDAATAIDGITRDLEGIWVNPQRDPNVMPTAGQVSKAGRSTEEHAKRALSSTLFGAAR